MSKSHDEHLLDVKDGVCRVRGVLVLRGITDQTLLICESHVGGSDTVSLVVDEDLNLSILHHTNTAVSSSQIDTDDCSNKNIAVSHHAPQSCRWEKRHTSSIVLLWCLLFSVCGSEKRQWRNEDKKQVEDGCPSRERLGSTTATRQSCHYVCELCVGEDTKLFQFVQRGRKSHKVKKEK